ncbi:alpha/beta hydrolase-fold protein [Sphingomonas sp. NIBR02145]|uniref:alpha/beta hydrolase n=1 Tax=Sphingomonas sp. NIBR02145 TaxID=3014784 RepID=UPI0022B47811|nr:alpha/beta hydrolase-fold protein [Sphingomonas sp. NIBR02145]WHU03486.1 alpha/beta hydrolase-fold protein [Sphingomonas sp. NIBR02145]
MPLLAWFACLLALIATPVAASTLERGTIDAASLRGNAAGLPSARGVTVYLPDSYAADPTRRFPVLYYLTSFFEDDRAPWANNGAQALLDRAIDRKVVGPAIVVTIDCTTPVGGSWYVNSPVTGNWEDLVSRELVAWVDGRYRTLASRDSRGIAGDRMGGHGAIRLAMRHPEVFGAVYALHPIGMGPGVQTMFSRPNWQLLQDARRIEDLRSDGFSLIFTSIFQAHLPNATRAPLFFDPPARLAEGRLAVDPALTEKLNASFFLDRQVAAHAGNLKRLRGFMFDWARGDSNPDHIVSLLAFTRTLDSFGVPYEAEEYRGGWGERHWGEDGRIYSEMLPFFARTLVF